ncbi:nad dependent epimerase dehydratase family protein [Colletotrichum truncatum]|uniref:Nad dependent epimerase dehydratase family protein n=1 Tax=Colletotrichum truncatum TaxID=5467 RepID=A0ACC3YDC8_COLTU|nr:nad dependent epimerase dehydratase family protein [Colletotrichum truncatum]KAF6783082.1 nad dependent epimerase dehydratase family protein [Colletotrichum truncatum]
MSSSSAHLRQIGIYRNLPTFDESIAGLTAIVTGANGISGFNTMRALLDSPQRWETIYCLSRRPPPNEMMALLSDEARSRIKMISCDFLDDPTLIAKSLKSSGVRADHIFFYSYIHKDWSEAEALVKSNTALLKNFLEALELADIKPTRFILQTGGKNYGMHIGRAPTPKLESDPQPRHLAPNFYYHQEDLLKAFCERTGTKWNVIRPAAIIGSSTHAAMNTFYRFAVYAAVQARKGEPLVFGGDWEQWQYEYYHCSARMTGYLSEWAALEKPCANEAFNTNDGGPFTYERFFAELARWFGAKGVIPPPDDDSKMATVEMGCGGKNSPLGYGPPMLSKSSFCLGDWARDERNAAVWRDIMEESGGKITSNPFDDIESFSLMKWAYHRFGSVCLNKARRFGWTGFVDTMESIFEMYQEMGQFGALPTMQVESARPLC